MISEDLYKNKETLLEMIKDCEGLTSINVEEDNSISAYDTQERMDLYFHCIDNRNYDELFEFGSLKINKERFYNILNETVDNLLFLMPRKVFFISSEQELDEILSNEAEGYDIQTFDMRKNLGKNWTQHSAIVINIELSKKISKEHESFGVNINTVFNEIVWTTLIHELRHMVCNIGLIVPEELIPLNEGEEDAVEDYSNNVFWNDIVYNDYICFNI